MIVQPKILQCTGTFSFLNDFEKNESNPKSKMRSEGFESVVAGECGATDDFGQLFLTWIRMRDMLLIWIRYRRLESSLSVFQEKSRKN